MEPRVSVSLSSESGLGCLTLECCHYCKSIAARKVFQLNEYAIFQCQECALWFNPTVREENARTVFGRGYHFSAQSAAFVHSPRGLHDPSAVIWQQGLDAVRRSRPKPMVVDVGCATGSFLEYLSGHGFEAEGVELSPSAVAEAIEVHGLPVREGRAEDLPLFYEDESLDVVTMWDVVEHVQDVQAALQSAYRALRPGGALVLATDNYDSWLGDVTTVLYRASGGALKYPVRRFWIPFNTIYPTRAWLGNALRSQGFTVETERSIDYPEAKMNLNLAEQMIVGLIYAIGRKVGRTTQIAMTARKEG